jgi:hypothetical protein
MSENVGNHEKGNDYEVDHETLHEPSRISPIVSAVSVGDPEVG